jgi:hypothetical protein
MTVVCPSLLIFVKEIVTHPPASDLGFHLGAASGAS